MVKTRFVTPFFLILALYLPACTSTIEDNAAESPTPVPIVPTEAFPTVLPATPDLPILSFSNNDMHYHSVHIDLASYKPIDIPLDNNPVWIAGIPHGNGSAWAVAFENGSLEAYVVKQSGYTQTSIIPENLPSGMPVSIYSKGGRLYALAAPSADASPFTQPVLLDTDLPKIAYIATNGDLVIWHNMEETRLPVDALPDSRILTDESGRLLILSNPTERYTHGVLGDSLEAEGIALVETNPKPRILIDISIPELDVVEGLYPTWVDLNNDSEREIIVTLSNAREGARLVVFREDGSLLAEGPPIGEGFRWRHQLMVAPFGADGENLLAVVRTPHIGGVLEFYRLQGNKLEIVTEIPGISTHSIGSRNLFTAQAGDFDNDGQVELLAPDQSHTRFGILGIDDSDITWLNLEDKLVTNLAAVTFHDPGEIWIAAGTSNNVLRIWLP